MHPYRALLDDAVHAPHAVQERIRREDHTRVVHEQFHQLVFPAAQGHGEGDLRLISGFVKLLCGENNDLTDITTIDATVISHDIALAAEKSRKLGGEVIRLGQGE